MIAIQRPGGDCLYLLDDGASYDLADDHLTLPNDTLVADVSAATAEVATAVTAPPLFVGGAMRWAAGAWTITDQPAYDAAKAVADAAAAVVHVAAVEAQFAARVAAGLSYQGAVIDIDPASISLITAMGATAGLVIAAIEPEWETGLQRWIARGNTTVQLPTPQAGLALARAARTAFSALVQHESDLIADPTSDPTTGWP